MSDVDGADAWFAREASTYRRGRGSGLFAGIRASETRAVLAAVGAAESVLELGCGAGHYSARLMAQGVRVVAVDPVPQMVEAARVAGVDAHLGDGATVQMNPASVVLAAGVLEFVDSPQQFLANGIAHALEAVVLLVPRVGLAGRMYQRWHRSHGVHARLFADKDIEGWAEALDWRVARVVSAGLFARVYRLEPT